MAAQYVPPDGAAGMVTVLYAGWIDAGRGIRELAQMVSRSPHVRLRVAGSGDDDLLGELADRERIELLGQLTHVEALRETAACDFVAALYDPDRVINRFAASNKIAEALAIGRPNSDERRDRGIEDAEEYQCIVRIRYEDAAPGGGEARSSTLRRAGVRGDVPAGAPGLRRPLRLARGTVRDSGRL